MVLVNSDNIDQATKTSNLKRKNQYVRTINSLIEIIKLPYNFYHNRGRIESVSPCIYSEINIIDFPPAELVHILHKNYVDTNFDLSKEGHRYILPQVLLYFLTWGKDAESVSALFNYLSLAEHLGGDLDHLIEEKLEVFSPEELTSLWPIFEFCIDNYAVGGDHGYTWTGQERRDLKNRFRAISLIPSQNRLTET